MIGLLLAIGLACLVQAAYIPAKGWLAQRLLERAWDMRRPGESAPPPWPWADTRPLARLRQPRLGVDQVVLEGASGRVLAFAPGWIQGTAPPGAPGNVVISGHRDTHFAWLADLQHADRLQLTMTDGRRRDYRIATIAVHHADDTAPLDPYAGDQLQLVTCYPFDAVRAGTPWRYIVSAYPASQTTP
jgi:sortase A